MYILLYDKPVMVGSILKEEILNKFNQLIKLKKNGINLFFTDIDNILNIINKENNI